MWGSRDDTDCNSTSKQKISSWALKEVVCQHWQTLGNSCCHTNPKCIASIYYHSCMHTGEVSTPKIRLVTKQSVTITYLDKWMPTISHHKMCIFPQNILSKKSPCFLYLNSWVINTRQTSQLGISNMWAMDHLSAAHRELFLWPILILINLFLAPPILLQ